jgi:hypothetical protein
MKTVVYQREAIDDLRRYANRAQLIRSKIEQYATAPAAQANNVKKLTGSHSSACVSEISERCSLKQTIP